MTDNKKTTDSVSPMQAQYKRIKSEHTDEVLFFRLGDFYEMFENDAIEVSKLLNLTLTHRNNLPMCGIPYHSSRTYIARLLREGKKIAICEQVAGESASKTLMERVVTEVITPGTTIEEDFLEKDTNNYLACLYNTGKEISFAYIELSGAEFYAYCIPIEDALSKILQELTRLDIREIIVPQSIFTDFKDIAYAMKQKSGLLINSWMDWAFDIEKGRARLLKQFGASNLKNFGLDDRSPEIFSAGALLNYIDETSNKILPHIKSLKIFDDNEFLSLDESTLRNLEILYNLKDNDVSFSLLEVCDHCRISSGRRLLRYRLTHPLLNIEKIKKRLTMVDFFYTNTDKLNKVQSILSITPDLQRQMARLAMNKSHGKDLLSLKNALDSFIKLHSELTAHKEYIFFESNEAVSFNINILNRLKEAKNLLEDTLFEDPSILLTDGKLIKRGFNAELDRLHDLHNNGRTLLQQYLEEEKKKTGINNLKIHYNRLIGYFFEVSNQYLQQVPPYFIKRQGLSTAERYSSERLANLESEINGAYDKIVELEKTLFLQLRDNMKKYLNEIECAASIFSEFDVASSFANAARINRWVKPSVNDSKSIKIKGGRHPVVESHIARGTFIPNDLVLCADDNMDQAAFMLLTGPNMAGKSTYLRQAALIVLLSQCGSFVPSASAEIGLVDRIYCRVGASDNLARGESTFFVEMSETAYILNTATDRSLVIMDEVGRGTSADDGRSIAQAVSEYLLDTIRCRTLFATHYHELTAIKHSRLINCSLKIDDSGGNLVFLRTLVNESARSSYGLHVASLAGINDHVLRRANYLLNERNATTVQTNIDSQSRETRSRENQIDDKQQAIIRSLLSLDINNLRPLEALAHLDKLQHAAANNAPLKNAKKSASSASKNDKDDTVHNMELF
ncbi:MAG: DNA mismatch repair protein MutS [Termitinemataceae bacterium]|nr:MAG: DNA mismatch repair protein MutS [Termitinemataceae bacterium]